MLENGWRPYRVRLVNIWAELGNAYLFNTRRQSFPAAGCERCSLSDSEGCRRELSHWSIFNVRRRRTESPAPTK